MLQPRQNLQHVSRLLLVIALIFIAACDDDNSTNNPGTNTNRDTVLSDGDILHVALTLNQGEVMTNQPAVTKGTIDSVRQFAQMMVTEHGTMVQRVQQAGTTEGITLRANPISTSLNNSAAGIVAQLNGLTGAEFDRMHMETQVTLHSQALTMLDFTLIPRAQDPQVKTLLNEMRASVVMHLERARRLFRSMI